VWNGYYATAAAAAAAVPAGKTSADDNTGAKTLVVSPTYLLTYWSCCWRVK